MPSRSIDRVFSAEADADKLLEHIDSPFHRGHLDPPCVRRAKRNPRCGDQIEVQLRIRGARVEQAWFDGQGCTLAVASASMLCEWVEGRSIDECLTLRPEHFLVTLGTPISPARQRCALLGFEAFASLLRDDRE